MTPMDLAGLDMQDIRSATNLLEDHITMMEEKGYATGYVEDYLKAIKSWFRHFDIRVMRKIKVNTSDYTPTLQNE